MASAVNRLEREVLSPLIEPPPMEAVVRGLANNCSCCRATRHTLSSRHAISSEFASIADEQVALMTPSANDQSDILSRETSARTLLDVHTVKTVKWHFDDATGCPFWLEKKRHLGFDPLTEIQRFEDLKKFEPFQDEWLRGGPVRQWVPQALADKPIYVFETGGTTGRTEEPDRDR